MRKNDVKRIIIMVLGILLVLSSLVNSSLEKKKYGPILRVKEAREVSVTVTKTTEQLINKDLVADILKSFNSIRLLDDINRDISNYEDKLIATFDFDTNVFVELWQLSSDANENEKLKKKLVRYNNRFVVLKINRYYYSMDRVDLDFILDKLCN